INAISPSPACYCLRAQSILHWASLCLSPHLFHPTLREKVKLFVSGYVCRERQRESESVCVCVCMTVYLQSPNPPTSVHNIYTLSACITFYCGKSTGLLQLKIC